VAPRIGLLSNMTSRTSKRATLISRIDFLHCSIAFKRSEIVRALWFPSWTLYSKEINVGAFPTGRTDQPERFPPGAQINV
jgi:hypothetical protein